LLEASPQSRIFQCEIMNPTLDPQNVSGSSRLTYRARIALPVATLPPA
jgi:hypothetical protein